MLAPASLKEIHPLGKAPIVKDGDVKIAETGAIIEYILRKYGNGRMRPAETSAEFLRYEYWMFYAESNIMMILVSSLVFNTLPKQAPWFMRPLMRGIASNVHDKFIDPQLKLNLDFIEAELGKSTWFAGEEVTGCDVIMTFPLMVSQSRASGAYPRIAAFIDRVKARPAWQKAEEKGGKLEILS